VASGVLLELVLVAHVAVLLLEDHGRGEPLALARVVELHRHLAGVLLRFGLVGDGDDLGLRVLALVVVAAGPCRGAPGEDQRRGGGDGEQQT